MNAIDVSVVIPTYHRERELREAVDSVLSQPGLSLEVIVVDDSPEGSAQATVAGIADGRVHYLRRAVPSGGRPAMVRNEGAARAAGRYLVFLDDDDQLAPGALPDLAGALDAQPAAGMAFGAVTPFGADLQDLQHNQVYFAEARRIARRLRRPRELGATLVYRPAILINSACMARRSVFTCIGGYDAEIPICEDADLWSRMAQAAGFVFVDRPVARYRTGAPSLMHSLGRNEERMRTSYRRIQGKYRQANGLLRSLAMKAWARVLL